MEDESRNISHLLKCKYKLALVYKELQEIDACKKQCDSIIELADKVDLTDSTEEIVTWTVELSEDCERRLNN